MPVFTSSIEVTADYPTIKPSLNLNFARSCSLDPRITFTRASVGTYVGRDGLIKTAGEDEARFDHDPDTLESLGLLIEESRTNIANNNSTVGSWNNASTSQETANPIKGLYTHRVIDVSTDGDSPWLSGSNYTTGTVTMSMYIDAVNSTSNTVTMYLFGGGYISTTWTLTTGVPIHNGGFSINGVNHSNGRVQTIDCGGGIYRLVLTADYSGGTTASRFYITPSNTDTGYVIVAGMQMEQGSFPTSYIPTSGSSATRAADIANILGANFSSWYNPIESSILCNYSHIMSTFPTATGSERAYRFRASSGVDTRIDYVTFNAYHPYISVDGVEVANLTGFTGLYNNQLNKTAVGIQKNNFSSISNGDLKSTDTSGNWPPTSTINELYIGSSSGNYLNGHIQKFAYYPQRLTNDQLQTLTK